MQVKDIPEGAVFYSDSQDVSAALESIGDTRRHEGSVFVWWDNEDGIIETVYLMDGIVPTLTRKVNVIYTNAHLVLLPDEIGSVSSGTMRAEDLIPAFMDMLRAYWPAKAVKLESEYANVFAALDDEDNRGKYGFNLPDEVAEDAGWLVEELFDSLDELAPDNCYFGAHPSDGADYGFWYSEDYEDSMMEDIGD